MADDVHQIAMRHVLDILSRSEARNADKLAQISHLLGKYRSELIKRRVVQAIGLEVQSGPFSGMRMPSQVAEGCFVAKLLGTYESELHATLMSLGGRSPECVVNIGCAEGYYAVGLARLWEDVAVFAYDGNPTAQRLCRRMAVENGVSERITIGGSFSSQDFQQFAGRRVVVFCDIEGGELELLDPERAPALREFDILVEMHDTPHSLTSQLLPARFEPTHRVHRFSLGGRDPGQFPILQDLSHLDQLLAIWEWRSGPTPWAYFENQRVPTM